MTRVVKYIVVALLVAATFGLTGCAKQQGGERHRRTKFQVVSLDRVTGSMSSGWRLTLTVANNTASNMRITSASAFIYQSGRKIARVALDGEVLLPRRSCSQVEVPLRITLSNPIVAISMLNQLRKGDMSGITIDYNIAVTALASHRIFEQEQVPLEALAKAFNFGLKK